jgi:hypothetical protein
MRYIVAILLATPLFAIKPISIVNIDEKEPGYYGDIRISTEFDKGNTNSEQYSFSTSIQKFNVHNVWLFSGKYTFKQDKIDGTYEKTKNSSFVHIRNIREITKSVNWEYFFQSEHNEFQSLSFRGLTGIGIRVKPFSRKIYFGVSGMYVRESSTEKDIEGENTIRGNFYVNMVCPLTNDIDISYIMYFQPAVDLPKDYEFYNSLQVESKLTKHFSLTIGISYDYDTNPLDKSLKKYDLEQVTQFRYKF